LSGQDAAISLKAPLFPTGRLDYQTLQLWLSLLQQSACSAGAMDPLREIALIASVLRRAAITKPEYELRKPRQY
jgi:hypothetical protein